MMSLGATLPKAQCGRPVVPHGGKDWGTCQPRGIASRTIRNCNGATRMDALSPAMVHELAELVSALALLVKAIWPNGIGR